jgi:hypothetical protein
MDPGSEGGGPLQRRSIDESCTDPGGDFEIGRILHLKSESRNLGSDYVFLYRLQSNLRFRLSDLRCRIRPISKSPGEGEPIAV